DGATGGEPGCGRRDAGCDGGREDSASRIPQPASRRSHPRCAPGTGCRVLFRVRPPPRVRAGLLRALRGGVGARRALLPRLRRARRRLTLAFPRGISYQCPTFRPGDGSVTSVILRMVVALVALAAVASTADAQRRARRGLAFGPPPPSVGFRVGYDFDADHTFLGGSFNLPVWRRVTPVRLRAVELGATVAPSTL